MAKFAKVANWGGNGRALVFYDDLALSPALERQYNKEILSAEERVLARQSLETKEKMIRLGPT